MYNPLSTYRIQFNKDFTFKNFKDQIEYLDQLGIGTIYSSPVFKAAPGSIHGYDVTDPHVFNPEIGDEKDFNEIIQNLKEKNIGWLQDIVPNHMAMHIDNLWLLDVLKRGRASDYAGYFDIDFSHPDFSKKFIVPFLGKSAGEAIKDGEIKLKLEDGRLGFSYYDFFFPVKEETERSVTKKETDNSDLNSILNDINSNPHELEQLLKKQHYLLSHWQEASDHLNYRRFFTINSLISLKMEDDKVFTDYHSFISKLVSEKKIQGLRVDHIDGLRLPERYLEKLRVLAGDDTYIIVEKILEKKESLILSWPIEGTSGYDFLGMVNNLLTYKKNYHLLKKFYQEFTGIIEHPDEIIYRKKKLILTTSMQGDLDNLCRLFENSKFIKNKIELSSETIREVISEFLIYFPRYKSYSWFFPLSSEDKNIISRVISKVSERTPSLGKALKIIKNLFTDQQNFTEEKKSAVLEFFLRCMQYTGPLMAKGVEDTVMYYYNCFIAHNEVGDSVDAGGISVDEFHQEMQKRLKTFPMSLNATSTHDTKRGEDVRARLNVISEFPDEWIKLVKKWKEYNNPFKVVLNNKIVPSFNEEYFIYQTLIGIYPFNKIIDQRFIARLEEYFVKALREAKISSDWNEPDIEYENSVISFINQILKPESEFLKSFLPFQTKISFYGIFNSLSQLFLKATCPGIPDFYQGSELWDFSLVDPDNRRPVDYSTRKKILNDLIKQQKEEPEEFKGNLYDHLDNGYLKLWFTHILLKERSLHPQLFRIGLYIPLKVTGSLKDHVIAYARVYKNTWYIISIPLYTGLILEKQSGSLDLKTINWLDTEIEIPALAPEKWMVVQDGSIVSAKDKILLSGTVKMPLPCLLKGTNEPSTRKAGILLHISSLPGKFGTGDLGEGAHQFADYLWESGQSFWQIMPINPAEGERDYSPYSTSSVFAGNLLFLNPIHLSKLRLIDHEQLVSFHFEELKKSDFKKAEQFRLNLLEEAYQNFKKHDRPYLQHKFNEFCNNEKSWIDDYAIYVTLKNSFKGEPWINWPNEFIISEKGALEKFSAGNADEVEKNKFFQFLFNLQWKSLHEYVNQRNVKIIGEIPFYVHYDSVEVWKNPELFKLDRKRRIAGNAGMQPDHFNEKGQIWDMPVYHWKNMKKDNFIWWRKRIEKSLEHFDLMRFHYFRGFSNLWEVPPGEIAALKGKWKSSPGYSLFKLINTEHPNFPFIGDELRDIDEEVFKFRDYFHFPQIEVLQFAFDLLTPNSIHFPFNHTKHSIVYTGTPNDNTVRGWFKNELTKEQKLFINEYFNKVVKIASVHLDFMHLCYNSVAAIAIIPMQDILGLDATSRFNNSDQAFGNWTWKLKSKDLNPEVTNQIRKLVNLYARR